MQTLASRILRAGKLTEVDAAGWIIRLAKTMEHIHDLGVAHGGITAEAIVIDGPAPSTRGLIMAPRQVREQPAYHSAERAAGEGASPEDDTWAAAVTLYFALTRTLPFAGDDDRAVWQRVLSGPPAPLTPFGVGDDRLQEILDRAFSRDVKKRITSLAELRQALEQWRGDPGVKDLSALEFHGSLLLALRPPPARKSAEGAQPAAAAQANAAQSNAAAAQANAAQSNAAVAQANAAQANAAAAAQANAAAAQAELQANRDDEEEDEPTRVRDAPLLMAQLAALKEPEGTPKPRAAVRKRPEPGAVPFGAKAPSATGPVPPARESAPAATGAVPVAKGAASATGAVPAAKGAAPSATGAVPAAKGAAPAATRPVLAAKDPSEVVDEALWTVQEALSSDADPASAAEPAAVAKEPLAASAAILPLQRDSAPEIIAVAPPPEAVPAQSAYARESAPILPFQRDSAPPDIPKPPAATPAPPAARTAQATPAAQVTPATPATPQEPVVVAKAAPPKSGSRSPLTLVAALVVFLASGGLAFYLSRGATPAGSGSASASPAPAAPPNTASPSTASAASAPAAPTGTIAATASASGPEPQPSGTAAPSASASVAPTGTAAASAATSSTATASAAPTTTATAAASPSSEASTAGAAACMVALFAPGTFASPPSELDSTCKVTDPREGVKLLKTQVIVAGEKKAVSDGMREWAIIGWYGMPAFAAMRAVCCPSAPELHISFKDPSCDLETALKRLATAASSAAADDTEVANALQAYTKAVICTANSGASTAFGQKGGIIEGELVTFQKTLARTRAAAKSK